MLRCVTASSYVPIVVSLLVLGAHFLRYGNLAGVLAVLILVGLLFVPRPWAARVVQAALVLGTLEWLRTLFVLVRWRAAHGEPIARMAVILAVVAALTLGSALLFQSRRLRALYGLER
jgi:hypothetical protein